MNQRGAPRARNELRARRCAIAVGGRPLNTALGCTVSLRRKVYTWIALVLSIPAALYAGLSVIFYAWLNAAEPERWPADRAGLWVVVCTLRERGEGRRNLFRWDLSFRGRQVSPVGGPSLAVLRG